MTTQHSFIKFPTAGIVVILPTHLRVLLELAKDMNFGRDAMGLVLVVVNFLLAVRSRFIRQPAVRLLAQLLYNINRIVLWQLISFASRFKTVKGKKCI